MKVHRYCTENVSVLPAKSRLCDVIKKVRGEKNTGVVFLGEDGEVFAGYTLETLERLVPDHKTSKDRISERLESFHKFAIPEEPFIPVASMMLRDSIDLLPVKFAKGSYQALELRKVVEVVCNQLQVAFDQHAQVENYVSMLSHDIRAPLSIISVCCDYLQSSVDLADQLPLQVLQTLGRIANNATKAQNLVSSLLDIGLLKAKKTLEFEQSPVRDYLRELVENQQVLADRRQVSLLLECPEDFVQTMDPQRITQVLENLIGNAIKFSPTGGTITVTATLETTDTGNVGLFSVADQGPGIPEEDRKRIFSPFEQLDATVARKTGVGLGLSIAWQFVNMHMGKFEITANPAEAQDRGSVFLFTLPDAVPMDIWQGQQKSQSPLVLVVDDDQDVVAYVSKELEEAGFQTICAQDGRSALTKFNRIRPSLVLSDIRMPDMDGIELLTQIRLMHKDCKIVLMSGFLDEIQQRPGIGNFQPNGIIEKPFQIEELIGLLQQLAGESQKGLAG